MQRYWKIAAASAIVTTPSQFASPKITLFCTGGCVTGGFVAGGFVAGLLGSAVSQKISYGNVDWSVASLNGAWAAMTNLSSYIVLMADPDILSASRNFGKRILENMAPSCVGLGVTVWFASQTKPNFNELRNIEK